MKWNAVRLVAAIIALAGLSDVVGCNYTDGQCYRREDIEGTGSEGVGGGPIVPGWGGHGDVPPEPQTAAEPALVDCDIEQNPPKEDDTGADNNECGKLGSDVVTEGATYAYCEGPCEAECLAIGGGTFSPSAFKFTTMVADDGQGKAGGWQVTTATLGFVKWTSLFPESWTCTISLGMPLRTEVHGKVSAEKAAAITAIVATQASDNVRQSSPDLPGGIFCSKFKAEMAKIFSEAPLKTYGAKMMTP